MECVHTSTLCSRLKTQVDELELVDLIRKLQDEHLVELEALLCAPRVVEELDQSIGELMP